MKSGLLNGRGGNRGSEQDAGRPAIIVSNDKGNEHSMMVEVVYLTTQEKKPLPTHVDVLCKVPSIALCEQINSVSQDRLLQYVRTCTPDEMREVDKALMISLGLTEPDEPLTEDSETIRKLEEEADKMMQEINDLVDENERMKNAAPECDSAEIIRLTTERDMYKAQSEMYFERLLER